MNAQTGQAVKAWEFKVRGQDEWVALSERTSWLTVHEDQAAIESAKEHWRRAGAFKSIELSIRSPSGEVSQWVIDVEHRPSFLSFRRSPGWEIA